MGVGFMVEVLEIGRNESFVGVGGVIDGNRVCVGENLFLEGAETDTLFFAMSFDVVTCEEEVFGVEPELGIINVAETEGHGAKVVIASVMRSVTGTGTLVKLLEEGLEDKRDAKSCKEWAQGTALSIAFSLKEEAHVAFRVKEPAAVGLAVEEIEKGEERLKGFFRGKEVPSGGSGAFVEAVDEINEQKDASGGMGVVHEAVHAGTDDVEN